VVLVLPPIINVSTDYVLVLEVAQEEIVEITDVEALVEHALLVKIVSTEFVTAHHNAQVVIVEMMDAVVPVELVNHRPCVRAESVFALLLV